MPRHLGEQNYCQKGLSLPQLTRLIRRYRQDGHITTTPSRRHRFSRTYTDADIALLAIAERRRPNPKGRPGYLRVETVHQSDWEGAKGVHHLNAVDAVTQWEVIGCTERISEQGHAAPIPEIGYPAVPLHEHATSQPASCRRTNFSIPPWR